MSNEVLSFILRYGAAVVVGIIVGVLFSSGKVRVAGRVVTVPIVERNSRNFTIVVAVLLLASILAVANTSIQSNRQAGCNQEFRRVITENSALTAESAALQDRLWGELAGYLTTPPVVENAPPSSTTSPQGFDDMVTSQQIGDSINLYLAEREQAKNNRQNYPDAKCTV